MLNTRMVDMAKSPVEVKSETVGIAAMTVDRYPYGLSISLDNEALEKLGLDCECSVGDLLHGQFMAEVTSVSKHDSATKTEPEHRIELQIKFLSVLENEDDEGEEDMKRKPFDPKDMYGE